MQAELLTENATTVKSR